MLRPIWSGSCMLNQAGEEQQVLQSMSRPADVLCGRRPKNSVMIEPQDLTAPTEIFQNP